MRLPRAIPELSPLEVARFWSKVRVASSRNACWPWQGRRSAKGYGEFNVRGVSIRASRIAWRLFCGDPGSSHVLHSCDNPPCCNPFHLFLGDDGVNTADSITKQRRRGLTAAQRDLLLVRLQEGESVSAIARDLGLTPGGVRYHANRSRSQ